MLVGLQEFEKEVDLGPLIQFTQLEADAADIVSVIQRSYNVSAKFPYIHVHKYTCMYMYIYYVYLVC